MGYGCNFAKAYCVVRYIVIGLLLQMSCEIVSYYSQRMYHELCCANFAQFFLMRGSSVCSTMKHIDNIISPTTVASYLKLS